MFKNLKMLLKLRSWLKSDTLKAGGAVGLLGAAQAFFQSDDGMGILNVIATFLPLSQATLSGVLLSIIGAAMILLRAKTEWSLSEKNADAHKAITIASTNQRGFSSVAGMALTLVVGLALFLAVASVASAAPKTFSYTPPTAYVDGTPLPLGHFGYELGCGATAGERTRFTSAWAGGSSSQVVDVAPGIWFCALRTRTNAQAQYPNGVSVWSNEVTFTVPADPASPTNLSVD